MRLTVFFWNHRKRLVSQLRGQGRPAICQSQRVFDLQKPVKERFDKYSSRVASVVLHGSGGWPFCKGVFMKLRGWEGQCLRQIVHPAPLPGEEAGRYMRRATTNSRNIFCHRQTLLNVEYPRPHVSDSGEGTTLPNLDPDTDVVSGKRHQPSIPNH